MRKVLVLLLVLLALTITPALAQQEATVVDRLANDPDEQFTTLVAAVEAAGLAETLSGEGPFTVFAPTNDAFAVALETLGITEADLLGNTELLTQILTYHVVPERLFFRNLARAGSYETVQGEEITTALEGGFLLINGTATVVDIDNNTGNGVVQIIDSVLLPPSVAETLAPAAEATEAPAEPTEAAEVDEETLVDLLVNDPDERFTTLVAAVEAAGLAETLSGEGPFTVFAPTNDAFTAAFEALGITDADLLGNTELLTQILTYHVVPERLFFRNLARAGSFTTVQGEELTSGLEGGFLVINGTATVEDVDNSTSNGVLQVIDAVLLPPSLAATMMPAPEATEAPAETETAAGPVAHLRVAHLSPDAPAVDVFINGELSDITGLAYTTVTEWMEVPAGTYEVAVAAAGSAVEEAVIGPASITLAEGSWTTVAAVGSLTNGTIMAAIINEDYSELAADSARVTVFHGLEGGGAVDLTADGGVLIGDLAYPGAFGSNDGAFTLTVPAAVYNFQVIRANTAADPAVILDLAGTELLGGYNYFVAVTGTAQAPEVVVIPTDQAGMMAE